MDPMGWKGLIFQYTYSNMHLFHYKYKNSGKELRAYPKVNYEVALVVISSAFFK